MNARLSLPRLVAGLRAWTRTHDAHVRAAVELLIGHNTWLRRIEFRAFLHADSTGEVWINWCAARDAFDAGAFDRSSSTELAVLDLALALATNHYRLSSMGPANAALIATAVTAAVGHTRTADDGGRPR